MAKSEVTAEVAAPIDCKKLGQIVLVLQGGGALGAYQAGVYQALQEVGIEPDWVIGTSIGAINASLIAGNPPEMRLERLREFWDRVRRDPFAQMLGTAPFLGPWAANALTISGFTVPALSTRRAETEFELQDGQSFVIAGLMDNRTTDIYNKIPGLGDLPVLGAFFRSKSVQKSNSELMVLCTVKRISPSNEPVEGPKLAKPYMDPAKFDQNK